jgi:hypothetical protein
VFSDLDLTRLMTLHAIDLSSRRLCVKFWYEGGSSGTYVYSSTYTSRARPPGDKSSRSLIPNTMGSTVRWGQILAFTW